MDHLSQAKRVIQIEIDEINDLLNRIDKNFSSAIEVLESTISSGHKIVVVGVGKSHNIGHKIGATLNSTGAPCVILNTQNALHGDIGVISDGDTILALSYSGETQEILNVLPYLKRFDISKTDKSNKLPLTTDENLYELATRKQNIHKQLLKSIKETAIDCAIQFRSDNTEKLECYSFAGENDPNVYSYRPNISDEETDKAVQELNVTETIFKARKYIADGKEFAMKMDDNDKPTGILYDIDTYKQAKENPKIRRLPVGTLKTNPDGTNYIDYN